MIYFEEMNGMHNGSWDLMKYSSAAPLAIHTLCSTPSQFSAKFPSVDRDNRVKRELFQSTIKNFRNDLQPQYHGLYSNNVLSTEFVQPLLHIILPKGVQVRYHDEMS
jgi:hypothetical protein